MRLEDAISSKRSQVIILFYSSDVHVIYFSSSFLPPPSPLPSFRPLSTLSYLFPFFLPFIPLLISFTSLFSSFFRPLPSILLPPLLFSLSPLLSFLPSTFLPCFPHFFTPLFSPPPPPSPFLPSPFLFPISHFSLYFPFTLSSPRWRRSVLFFRYLAMVQVNEHQEMSNFHISNNSSPPASQPAFLTLT